ncbi:MAG: hypothetical protein JWL85_145 [Candidatus Saccharibacteria bacterium]|nr:hypothetical protein [Candidatus Saccharibacteria bacterium]
MKSVPLEDLTAALSNSWCAETSASPDKWSNDNPALGQCATTACVVQDYLGGDILNSVVTLPDGSTDSHYYNMIDSRALDLTKQQFPTNSSFTEGQSKTKGYESTRDYCLSYDATRERYETLKGKVEKALNS